MEKLARIIIAFQALVCSIKELDRLLKSNGEPAKIKNALEHAQTKYLALHTALATLNEPMAMVHTMLTAHNKQP